MFAGSDKERSKSRETSIRTIQEVNVLIASISGGPGG